MSYSLNFTKKYVLSLLLMIILTTLGFINLNYLISLQSNDSKIINMSGKQRVLSQIVYSSAITSNIEVLVKYISEMELSHVYLTSLPMSDNIKKVYFKKPIFLDEKVKTYISHAKKIKNQQDEINTKYIINHSHELLKYFDNLTYLYQIESENKIKLLKDVELYGFLFTIGVIFFIGFYIFKPANELFEKRAKEINDAKDYANIIIESNTNAIIAVGKDFVIKTYNKAAERIFGYSKEDMIGTKGLLKIVPSMYHEAHKKGIANHFKTGDFVHHGGNLELSAVRKNGEQFPIKISFGRNDNIDDYEKIVIANIQDITVEKEKEALLIQNEKIYTNLFELNKSIIMLINPTTGDIINVNNSAVEFYGYKKSEFIKLNISDINTLPLVEIEKVMNLAVVNQKNYFEFEHILSNNEKRHVKVHSTPTLYNKEIVLYVTVTDVTEEFDAKNKLTVLEEEFKNFFEFSNVGLVIIDLKGKILRVNKKLLDLFKYDSEEDLLIQSWKKFVKEDFTKYELSILNDFKNNKIEFYSGEKICIKKDGTPFNILITINSFKIDGTTKYVLASVVDITKLKIIENEIKELNKTLEEKVIIRTAELEESNEELEITIENLKQTQDKLVESEKMASLGGLVAGVAHEINTPVGIGLTSVSYFNQITDDISEKYSANNISQEEFEEYLTSAKELARQIDLNLHRAANLVNVFKQVAVSEVEVDKKEFNLKLYIEEIIFGLNYVLKNTKISIIVNGSDNLIINSYVEAYSQIITNLILNSLTHGYGKDDKGTISIDIVNDDNYLQLTYKDDGQGVKEENFSKIFEPFYTTNRIEGATGLGLNIVYNIVTQTLKGNINFISEENNGVCFIIKVPISLK